MHYNPDRNKERKLTTEHDGAGKVSRVTLYLQINTKHK